MKLPITNNPFPARFNSDCSECGELIEEGDETFAIEGSFVCWNCAEATDNICVCGKFKKADFVECWECHTR